jgi:dUTP pyrophosphatase
VILADWFHVNGVPVFAKTKAEAVRLWRNGKLARLYPKVPKMSAMKNHRAAVSVIMIVGDAVRELGSVPSGELYARLMSHMSLETYQGIIGGLKSAGLVKEESHLLTWVGPRMITKRWSEYGFWQYSCGCVEYQDGSERCTAHRAGLPALVEQIFEEPSPKKLTAHVHVDGGAVPAYHTSGSVGLDVAAFKDTFISPGETALVSLGIAVKPPEGHFFLMAARSSLFKRKLLVANGVGIIDPDFCGASDFISVPVYNFGTKDVWIHAGERIAQLIALPVVRVVFEERQLTGESRGGFGSTGEGS